MKVLSVFFHGLHRHQRMRVGRLAFRDGRCYFEYDAGFLEAGLNPSPFNLRWEPGLQEAPVDPFQGLHGVFNDSLPDGWGLLLMDRATRAAGLNPHSFSPLDRLAFIGSRAMGALSYEPDEGVGYESASVVPLNLAETGSEATGIFEGSLDEVIEHHTVHGSPSGGARPKILIGLSDDSSQAVTGAEDLPDDYRHWLVKFPTGRSAEQRAEGKLEYVYSLMARAAGIDMMPCQLYQSDNNAYFMTQRFDRLEGNKRVHVHTVAGLMHANFRYPDFEYMELMRLTAGLTRSYAEKYELFRRLVFNVVSGNRDDHTKNFAFVLGQGGEWVNSPAYDLTFSAGVAGQHSMMINGKGDKIEQDDLLAIADAGSIPVARARAAISEVAGGVANWRILAQEFELPARLADETGDYIEKQLLRIDPGSRPTPESGSSMCG